MSMKIVRKAPVTEDHDNPEWTEADFARAKGPDSLPAELLTAFPKTRGPQKAPTKKLVSLRLDPDILVHFKAQGAGWQSQINAVLRGSMSTGGYVPSPKIEMRGEGTPIIRAGGGPMQKTPKKRA